MVSEGVSDQLRRIGGLAAAAVVLAAALATFAILERLIGPATPVPAPRTERPASVGVSAAPPGAGAASVVSAAGNSAGADPLTQAQIRTQRELARAQRQEVALARRQAASVKHRITVLVHTGSQKPAQTSVTPVRHASDEGGARATGRSKATTHGSGPSGGGVGLAGG
jgi:hypothetical protein